MSKRRIVIVLGMHRSGTSLCANMLAGLGVNMADAAGPSPANKRGHWERPRINDLHDEVLALFGRRWAEDSHHLALPEGWWEDARVGPIRETLITWLRPLLEASLGFGFKDPRISRLLPIWAPILEALDAEPVYVACVRDPSQVARSLAARDAFAAEQAEYRWLVYNAHVVHGVGSAPICVIPYENWFTQPGQTIARLADFAKPQQRLNSDALNALAASIVDTDLRHDSETAHACKPAARRLHRLIAGSASGEQFGPELLALAANLVELEQSCLPMLREAVSLRVGVREQNRVIGDLNGLIERLRRENASLKASAPLPFMLGAAMPGAAMPGAE